MLQCPDDLSKMRLISPDSPTVNDGLKCKFRVYTPPKKSFQIIFTFDNQDKSVK